MRLTHSKHNQSLKAKDLSKIAIQRNYGFMKEVIENGDDSVKMVIKSLLTELGVKEEGLEEEIYSELKNENLEESKVLTEIKEVEEEDKEVTVETEEKEKDAKKEVDDDEDKKEEPTQNAKPKNPLFRILK